MSNYKPIQSLYLPHPISSNTEHTLPLPLPSLSPSLEMLAAIASPSSSSLISRRQYHHSPSSAFKNPSHPSCSLNFQKRIPSRRPTWESSLASSGAAASGLGQEEPKAAATDDELRQLKRSADWKAAGTYKESGVTFNGRIEGCNNGGLLIRFFSLLGFLPYPLLSPSHSFKDSQKAIQDIAKDLVGSSLAVKVIEVNEEEKKLIFSEKDAVWSKYSGQVKVGGVFHGRVASVEDYGAFVHLCFPDGCYYLTGLVHVSEVSWDLVQDVRDFLNEGDQVRVKVTHIDREKSRISLSIKQLEEDPLLETLDKVIPQEGQSAFDDIKMSSNMNMEHLPGLESICKELLQEDGITDVRLGRQGLEKRVVSQDLELWLSNVPAKDKQFTLLARAGRQVQEVYLTTALDQEGIKKAVQQVLARIP